MKIELYNLEEDIQELNDVSEDHPEIIEQMKEIMIKEHTPASSDRFKMKQLGDEV